MYVFKRNGNVSLPLLQIKQTQLYEASVMYAYVEKLFQFFS